MAHRPSSSRWRLIVLILAALPTMLIAGLACWILTTWLDVRDRLGHWRLTLRDAHGVEQGHGAIDLVADHWAWIRMRQAPYLTFNVLLQPGHCGDLTLSPMAAHALGATGASTCALADAQFQLTLPAMDRQCYVQGASMTGFCIFWDGLPGSPQAENGMIVADGMLPELGQMTASLKR